MLKPCWTQNDFQNNSDGHGIIIGTPPDMRTFVERTARFVAKNGLEFEKSIMNITPPPKEAGINFNFLMSSEDPFHGYYKQKLSEYLSQNQEDGDDNIKPDEDDVASCTEIIEPPPGITRTIIESAARYLSKKGLEAEKVMMDHSAHIKRYSFLIGSDPFHAFFRQKLTEYRSQNQQDGASNHDAATDSHDEGHEVDAQPDLVQPQFIVLPDHLTVRLPEGMNRKEFITMKLTAQFAAWYGVDFLLKLTKKTGFEFTNEADSSFERFYRFVTEYSKVFEPHRDLKEMLRKSNDAYMAAIHDGFFRLLQWDRLGERKWRLGGVKSMIDWHASLEEDFANKAAEEQPPLPGTGAGTSTCPPLPLPEEPEPMRQKFDEPADQFLAQHPGSSTIRVGKPGF